MIAGTLFMTEQARDQIRMAWPDLAALADHLRSAHAPAKSGLPWVKLVQFGDLRTDKNCLRHDANAQVLTGVMIDIDGGPLSIDHAAEILKPLRVLLYTTPSSTPQNSHFRVLAPLAEPIAGTPDDLRERHNHYAAHLAARLGVPIDKCSYKLSQAYYYGSIDGQPPITILVPETKGSQAVPIDHAAAFRMPPPEGLLPIRKDREPTPEGSEEHDDPLLIAECHAAAEAFIAKNGIGDAPSGTREWGLFNTLARKCNGNACLSAETIIEVMQSHGFGDVDVAMMNRVEGRGTDQIRLDLPDKFATTPEIMTGIGPPEDPAEPPKAANPDEPKAPAHNSRKCVARVLGAVADQITTEFVERLSNTSGTYEMPNLSEYRVSPELGWMEFTLHRGWLQFPGKSTPPAVITSARELICHHARTTPGLSVRERRQMASASNVFGLIKLTAGELRMQAAPPGRWDADPWVLNTPAGIVDLRSGVIRPRTMQDLCLKCTAVSPATGPTPAFETLLDGLSDGRPEVADYIVRHFGTLLTGNPDHRLLFLYGTGGNGKGTAIEFLAWLLNDYAVQIPTSTLMATKNTFDHETALARLCGARLVFADETEKGATWNEALVKQLTGGNTLSGRFRYHDAFNFRPSHKLVVVGNNRPQIEASPSMRRRYVEIDCNRTFAGPEVIHDLPARLVAEAPAILHRLIQAGAAVFRGGLHPPDAIRRDTAEVFDAADPIAPWRAERCEFDPTHRVFIADLWSDFMASLNGSPNPFTKSTELVNHLLHACPGIARVDKSVTIGSGSDRRVGKVLTGIRLRVQATEATGLRKGPTCKFDPPNAHDASHVHADPLATQRVH